MALLEKIRTLPAAAGVYLYKNAEDQVIYVGKAKNLRNRVSSYFHEGKVEDAKTGTLVREAVDVDYIVVANDKEALALENNWIKQKKPRYNILLRDDKTYPYLKLTLRDDYPRIAFTRRVREDGGDYFGPFLPGGLARKAIKLVQKLFQVRVCRIEIDGGLARPCLYYDMPRCLGPCVAGLTTKAAYDEAIQQARLFLSGRNEQLVRRLKKEMWEAAEDMDYERAAQVRDTMAE